MDEGWRELVDHGVPDGPVRPVRDGNLDAPAVRRALRSLDVDRLEERRRETLYAWLRGFRHHWPEEFRSLLGQEGEGTLARLSRDQPADPNRYLKLRRIAIENLSRLV